MAVPTDLSAERPLILLSEKGAMRMVSEKDNKYFRNPEHNLVVCVGRPLAYFTDWSDVD
jgi:hypothetical protein